MMMIKDSLAVMFMRRDSQNEKPDPEILGTEVLVSTGSAGTGSAYFYRK